MAYVIC